jgi:6-oxo-cyclohex-1-ene-carbonyl-CoA hydrolase
MALEWMPRDDGKKDHLLHTETHWGTEAPCVVYEKQPIKDPKGNEIDGIYKAVIRLNNPNQYNSYTTEMVKGVIAGFENASLDRTVVATVFTATGPYAFCTGGNTKEYSEYYSRRPDEYGQYMELFNHMVDSILACKKPVICRVNGMRVAGGQEIGMACDIAIASDLAIFGQAGPRHGSAPVGGSSDFLPWFLSAEDAMWNCISCEMWSAYKMRAKNLISKAVPVLKIDGEWVRNPMIITDKYVENGEIVYGEYKTGEEAKEARAIVKEHQPNADQSTESVRKRNSSGIPVKTTTDTGLPLTWAEKHSLALVHSTQRRSPVRIPSTSSSSARMLPRQGAGILICLQRLWGNHRNNLTSIVSK